MSRNSHKQWRRQVKKLRRKKIRQKLAEKRKIQARQEEEIRNKDPVYQEWLQQQDELEQATLEEEERIRQQQEQLWIRREIAAQKKFREEQAKEHSNMLAKEAERARIQREFEELQQKARNRLEEQQRLEEEMQRAFEEMLQKITDYIELGGPVPEELLADVQSNPNKETCPFFTKTGSCRYGLRCSRNHIRPKLGRILFFQNFFTHIQLEQSTPTEYGSDFGLEASNNELRSDYFEFFHDVTKELKKFGQIQNFRTCKNTQPHLRGNVFVEYLSEREAMKAYMELQGRYYAGKQINVEFSSITSWKTAVCGLSYANKCPKGSDCNYLHVFKNPKNLYNLPIFKQGVQKGIPDKMLVHGSSVLRLDDSSHHDRERDWRWSDSPESHSCEKRSHSSTRIRNKTHQRRNSKDCNWRWSESPKSDYNWKTNHSKKRSQSRKTSKRRHSRSRDRGKESDRKKSSHKNNPRGRTRSRSRSRNKRRCESSANSITSANKHRKSANARSRSKSTELVTPKKERRVERENSRVRKEVETVTDNKKSSKKKKKSKERKFCKEKKRDHDRDLKRLKTT